MTEIIVCGQAEILGNACAYCEDQLPRIGAVLTSLGWMCSEDCAADWAETRARQRAAAHVAARDLMCECDTCMSAGHPTAAERAEWAEYLASRGGAS